ncbi:MAG: VOC family protein [Bryobacterales bacterium]|jgi:PhnB protein|nr:VOC family protein [Bryobacterales bacterium]
MPIPEGFHTITPYLVVEDAHQAIALWQAAFGAQPGHLDEAPDGRIRHAQIQIGNSHLMITGGSGGFSFMPPIQHFGGTPVHLFLYVEDADAVFAQARAAGMEELMPMADQSYGRSGGLRDRFGFIWWITTAP